MKLIEKINFGEIIRSINKLYFSNFKSNNSNTKLIYKFIFINKIIKYNLKNIEKLYGACIKNKYIRIVKSKKMTSITKKLLKIYTNLWDLYKPVFISNKSYIAVLFDDVTYKS